jgi:hypothetical protein
MAMIKAVRTSETSVYSNEIIRRYILEGSNFQGILTRSRVISISTVSDYGLYDRASEVRSSAGSGKRIFPLAPVSRSALGSTQPPVQWVP